MIQRELDRGDALRQGSKLLKGVSPERNMSTPTTSLWTKVRGDGWTIPSTLRGVVCRNEGHWRRDSRDEK